MHGIPPRHKPENDQGQGSQEQKNGRPWEKVGREDAAGERAGGESQGAGRGEPAWITC